MHKENVLETVSSNNERLNVFNKRRQRVSAWDLEPKQFNILHKQRVKTIGNCVSVTLSCSGASQNTMFIAQHKCYKLLEHDIPTLWTGSIIVRNDYELFIVKFPSASWHSTPLFSFTQEHAPKVSQQVLRTLCINASNCISSLHTLVYRIQCIYVYRR